MLREAKGASARRGAVVVTKALAVAASVVLLASLFSTVATAGAGVSQCRERQWCTVTASGDVTPTASQLAIGNVSAGTALAVTQNDVKHQQLGGQILSGTLGGVCAWSQYARDWTAPSGNVASGCPTPVFNTTEFVANDGTSIWSGCYPRCFGGVPLRFDRRCGTHGRTFCYRRNCEEYANYFPWSASAHPVDPIRWTQRHRLDVRYLALHGDTQTGHPFYLVRDINAVHGLGNWVFVSGVACGITTGKPGSYHWWPTHQ